MASGSSRNLANNNILFYRRRRSGAAPGSGAFELLGGADGLALDFTDDSFEASTGFYGSAAVVGGGSQDGYDSSPDAAASSLLTYTSPSPKMTMGPSGTLRFGAHNLLEYSNDCTHARWAFSSVGIQTIADVGDGPAEIPGSRAFNLTETTVTGVHRIIYYTGNTIRADAPITMVFWLKDAGRGKLQISYPNFTGYPSTIIDLVAVTSSSGFATATAGADGWVKVVATGTGNASIPAQQFSLNLYDGSTVSYTGTAGVGIHIGPAYSYYTPAEDRYLKTTSAARYALPFEFSTAGVLQGIRVEEARTNLCLYSDDLTNAAWTKSNMTTAKTATGPDGVANSATTCTATAGNATALQAITSGSAARITSCYIKRRTGTGNIDLTQDNGSTWTTVTVTSDWTRVNLSSVTSTNPTVGIRVVTSGDAVDIALFQHEVGNSISSPIPTIGSAVTRLVDNISLATSAFPYNNSISTFFAYGSATPSAAGNYPTLIGSSSPGVEYSRVEASATVIGATSGTLYAFCTIGSSGNANANEIKSASAFATNDAAIAANGGTVGTDVSGSPASAPTSIVIGSRIGDSQLWGGLIKQIAYFPARKSNADLQTLTT